MNFGVCGFLFRYFEKYSCFNESVNLGNQLLDWRDYGLLKELISDRSGAGFKKKK